jgi:hypothetical protein
MLFLYKDTTTDKVASPIFKFCENTSVFGVPLFKTILFREAKQLHFLKL